MQMDIFKEGVGDPRRQLHYSGLQNSLKSKRDPSEVIKQREDLCTYLNSVEGAVPWQLDRVRRDDTDADMI